MEAWELTPEEEAESLLRTDAFRGTSSFGPNGGYFRLNSPYDKVMEQGAIADRPDYQDYLRSKTLYEYKKGSDGKLYRRKGAETQQNWQRQQDAAVDALTGRNMDKFDEYAKTAPPRAPALPPIGLTNFYGPPLQSQVAPPTPPFRLPGEPAGPAPSSPMPEKDYTDDYYEPDHSYKSGGGTLTNSTGAPTNYPHAGKVFIDRIEDNGKAVILDGSGDNYKKLDIRAQRGWKEGQWIDRASLPKQKRARRPVP